MPFDPSQITDSGDSGRVYRVYTATYSLSYVKDYSDMSNVPSGSTTSDSVYSNTTNNGSVWLGLTVSSTVPVRVGYTFLGWRASATDSSYRLYQPGENIPAKVDYGSTVTYYMHSWWAIKTYQVTYYANGGSDAPDAQTKNYGTPVNISSDIPTRLGYVFVKWNTAADGSGTDYTAGQVYSSEAGLSLYAIWKQAASVPTANKTTANIGESIVISTNRVDPNAVHTLRYSFENTSGEIATNVTTSYTWVIPSSFYSLLASKVSAVLVIYCTTFIDGVQSGDEQSLSITVTVPDSIKPTLRITATAVNEGDLATILGTALVQGYSKISFSFTATPGDSGSTIVGYSITGQDLPNNLDPTATTVVTNTLSGAGTLTWSVYVTDSRGRSSDIQLIQANVSAYSRPSISPISMFRCDSSGNANPYSGLYLNARAFYSATNIGSNTITSAKVYYRRSTSSSSSWTQAIDLTNETNAGSGVWTGAIGGGNIALEYSYEIKYEIQDSIGVATNQAAVYTVSYPMPSSAGISYGIYNDRLRLGGLVEEPGFVVDWATKLKNTLTIQDLNALGITGMIAGEGDNISLLLTGNK